MAESAWEQAWERINESYAKVAEQLAKQCPSLSWRIEHQESQHFPLTAYASFMRRHDAGADEDAVISISFHRAADELEFSSDISRGNGEILALGPSSTIANGVSQDALHRWIDESVSSTLEFVSSNELALLTGLTL